MASVSNISVPYTINVVDIAVYTCSEPGPIVPVRAVVDPSLPASIIARAKANLTRGNIEGESKNAVALRSNLGRTYDSVGSISLRWHRKSNHKSCTARFAVVNTTGSDDFDVILDSEGLKHLQQTAGKNSDILVLGLKRMTSDEKRKRDEDRRRKEEERARQKQEEARREREARDRVRAQVAAQQSRR
ncbi:hypothetical protein ACLMJK_008505 [Lecanora helva]